MNETDKKNNRIEIILRDIYESNSKYITTLPESDGYSRGKYNDLRFGEILLEEKLIMSTYPPFKLSGFGLEVCEKYDGWLKYLETIAELQAKQQAKLDNKEQLETEVLKLQKENLEYQETIREQQERIRNLEEQNKFIELLKGYWWVFIICLVIGRLLGMLWDIMIP